MLRNTPKHHFGSNWLDWIQSCQNFFRKFGSSKQCIQPQNTSFVMFFTMKVYEMLSCRRSAKCSETLPNIILGPICQIGCIRGKPFFESSISRTSAFSAKNKLLHDFSCRRFAECSETLPNIVLDLIAQIGCIRGKSFSGRSVPRTSAFIPKTLILHFQC